MVSQIFNIREGDEARLITNFACKLTSEPVVESARTVLRTLIPVETEIDSEDGLQTFLVRITPSEPQAPDRWGCVTMVDISERKRLEQDRAHLAAIVHSSEDAILSHDLNGKITSWNRGAQTIYGYVDAEMIGEPMIKLLAEDHVDDWPKYLSRLREGESISDLDVSRTAKHSKIVHVSLKISPIRNDLGHIVGASAVAGDISERKAAEERARLLMAELDHRVRNILAVVRSVVGQIFRHGESRRQLIQPTVMRSPVVIVQRNYIAIDSADRSGALR